MNISKLLIILFTLNIVKNEFGLKCFFYFEDTFSIYNIKNLYLESDQKKELDYTLKDSEKGEIKGKLIMNICGKLPLPEICLSKISNSSIYFLSEDKTICKNMLSSKREKVNYIILNQEEPLEGFKIHELNSSIDVLIKCEKSLDKDKNPNYEINENNNLVISSSDACGISNEAARVVFENKYIFCGIFFVLGLIFLFFGGYKWDTIFSFIGFLFGFSSVYFILWAFVKYKQDLNSYLIITAVAVIVGIIVACLCHSFSILSYLLLGFLVGYFITKYVLLTLKFKGEDYEILLLELGSGLAVGLICALVKRYMVAIMTSILGGFLISYTVGFSMGFLENFFDLVDKIRAGTDISVVNYVFFGLFIAFSLIGMFFQIKFIRAEKRKKEGEMTMEKLIIE